VRVAAGGVTTWRGLVGSGESPDVHVEASERDGLAEAKRANGLVFVNRMDELAAEAVLVAGDSVEGLWIGEEDGRLMSLPGRGERHWLAIGLLKLATLVMVILEELVVKVASQGPEILVELILSFARVHRGVALGARDAAEAPEDGCYALGEGVLHGADGLEGLDDAAEELIPVSLLLEAGDDEGERAEAVADGVAAGAGLRLL
jgi:hypothetical protein